MGRRVGDALGWGVGEAEGPSVGAAVGLALGPLVGAAVGDTVGALVGDVVRWGSYVSWAIDLRQVDRLRFIALLLKSIYVACVSAQMDEGSVPLNELESITKLLMLDMLPNVAGMVPTNRLLLRSSADIIAIEPVYTKQLLAKA